MGARRAAAPRATAGGRAAAARWLRGGVRANALPCRRTGNDHRAPQIAAHRGSIHGFPHPAPLARAPGGGRRCKHRALRAGRCARALLSGWSPTDPRQRGDAVRSWLACSPHGPTTTRARGRGALSSLSAAQLLDGRVQRRQQDEPAFLLGRLLAVRGTACLIGLDCSQDETSAAIVAVTKL